MGSLASLNDLVSRLTGGDSGTPETKWFYKDSRLGAAAAPTSVASRLYSMWTLNGGPTGRGSVPPTTTEIPTRTTSGAIGQADPGGGRAKWLVGMDTVGTQHGSVVLYDRLAHISGLDGTDNTAQVVDVIAGRYTTTASVGNEIWLEVYTQIGATGTTVTASYTNQAGTAAQTTVATAIGATNRREAGQIIVLPLQSGDTGVRSVESVTLAATTGTAGDFGVTIARPIVPGVFCAQNWGMPENKCFGVPGPIEVKTGACLALAYLTSVASTPRCFGALHFVEA